MKTRTFLLILGIAVSSLFLSSCSCNVLQGIKDQLSDLTGSEDETLSPDEALVENVLSGQTDLDAMSLDELLAYVDALQDEENAALHQDAASDLLYGRADTSDGFNADAEVNFDYPADAKVAVITDTPWVDKDFEAVDISANMSPEEKAEYDAMMQELDNFDADAFQQEIDGMLTGMDGFEDYDPYAGQDEPGDPDMPEIGDEWPDNELSRQVPKPSFDGVQFITSSDQLSFTGTVSLEDVKSYVAELKARGFTDSVNEQDQTIAGVTIYNYSAMNAAGYVVNVSFAAGVVSFSIVKN